MWSLLTLLLACSGPLDPVRVDLTYAGDHKAPGHVVYLDVSITNDGDVDALVLLPTMLEVDSTLERSASSVSGPRGCTKAIGALNGHYRSRIVWHVPAHGVVLDRCDFRISGEPVMVDYVVADGITIQGRTFEAWAAEDERRFTGDASVLLEHERDGATPLILPPE